MSLGKEFVPDDVACLHSIRRHYDGVTKTRLRKIAAAPAATSRTPS